VAKNAKISASKLNLKAQNIHVMNETFIQIMG